MRLLPASKFDAAQYLNTHPALLSRAYNRPTMEMLQSGALNAKLDDDTLAVSMCGWIHSDRRLLQHGRIWDFGKGSKGGVQPQKGGSGA